jgi:hypothetical protein
MAGCGKTISVFVPTRYSHKEIKQPCGSTRYDGGINLCEECGDKYSKQYPQGWREVPGDICKHGNYVGDAGGPDYICGACEMGE